MVGNKNSGNDCQIENIFHSQFAKIISCIDQIWFERSMSEGSE